MDKHFRFLLVSVILILIAVFSATFLADWAMSEERHVGIVSSIDEKLSTVKVLTASSTLASVGVTALPGDVATPIADKLADCTGYFLVVMCVLYAEKYLLTLIGAAVFRFVVPVACVLGIFGMYKKSVCIRQFVLKLVSFGILLYLVIPLSVKTSDMIYATYQVSIDETIANAQDLTDTTDAITDAEDNPSVIDSILSYFKETTADLTEKAAGVLNRFTEAIAVMIVTTCLIPILVLLFFIWLVKAVWGVTLPSPFALTRKSLPRPGKSKASQPMKPTDTLNQELDSGEKENAEEDRDEF